MKKWIKGILFLIVILAIGIVPFLKKSDEPTTYNTLKVRRGDIETIISGTGTIVASKEIKEYSKVSAKVKEIYYLEGDRVEIGYPIIKLDSSSYEAEIKAQEIAIKQAELSKQNIENQINNLKIIAENDGYVSNLEIEKGSYVTNAMAICDVVKDNKFEIVLEFTYYENNPIIVGTSANITIMSSLSTLTGTVTKVSDMRKIITGNAQVVDVTIEVETSGYSLEGLSARAEVSNGANIISSVNASTFSRVNLNVIRAKTTGIVKEVYVHEGKKINVGDVIAVLDNPDLEHSLKNANLTLENLNNQLNIMKNNLEDYLISATIKGTITNQDVEVGDVIMVGDLLTIIADKEMMEFVIPINELNIAKLNYNQEVRVTIDAISETKDNPLVGRIIDIADEGTTTGGVTNYYATIQVVGNEKMKILMNAKADIVIESVKDVLYVPIDVLIKENDKIYVDVLLSDGITVERKEVTIGIGDMMNVEIKEGLVEGENVIISSF